IDEQWRIALWRYNWSSDAKEPEISASLPLVGQKPDVPRYENFAKLHFVGPRKFADRQGPIDPIATLKTQMAGVVSHVVASPDPPLHYRSRRVRDELKLSFPIFVIAEPGTERLIFIDQKESYGQA